MKVSFIFSSRHEISGKVTRTERKIRKIEPIPTTRSRVRRRGKVRRSKKRKKKKSRLKNFNNS